MKKLNLNLFSRTENIEEFILIKISRKISKTFWKKCCFHFWLWYIQSMVFLPLKLAATPRTFQNHNLPQQNQYQKQLITVNSPIRLKAGFVPSFFLFPQWEAVELYVEGKNQVKAATHPFTDYELPTLRKRRIC